MNRYHREIREDFGEGKDHRNSDHAWTKTSLLKEKNILGLIGSTAAPSSTPKKHSCFIAKVGCRVPTFIRNPGPVKSFTLLSSLEATWTRRPAGLRMSGLQFMSLDSGMTSRLQAIAFWRDVWSKIAPWSTGPSDDISSCCCLKRSWQANKASWSNVKNASDNLRQLTIKTSRCVRWLGVQDVF